MTLQLRPKQYLFTTGRKKSWPGERQTCCGIQLRASPGKKLSNGSAAVTLAELIFGPEFEQDLTEAYAWYEDGRPGLGEEFLNCVDACIEAICRTPDMHAVVHENYRRGLVRRFPYAVFYEHVEGTVTIYGVLHTARDPAKWRQRLP